jgi:nicotinamidase-related amidase
MRLTLEESVILLIDWQEKLLHAMPDEERQRSERNASILLKAAAELNVPSIATEQYPKGLGPTALTLRALLPSNTPRIAKTAFSAVTVPEVKAALEATGRKHVVLLGMEAHICVWQTAQDLLEADYTVSVVADAVLSRAAQNRDVGLRLMESAGASIRSTETVVFEWIGGATHPGFKSISRLVR